MTRVLVTGVTGKSGLFFYEELRRNVEKLSEYEFYFVVRNKARAEALLNCEKLNQHLLVGSLKDPRFVSTIFEMGGGKNAPSYSGH